MNRKMHVWFAYLACSDFISNSLSITDIFVMPFTTYDDPLKILVTNNVADQIIARIFGLVCGIMGYQKIQYVPWTSRKIGEKRKHEGIINNITIEGAYNEKNMKSLSISLSLGVRYLPETHRSYDHGKNYGPITMPGFYGVYRVSAKGKEIEQDLSYRILQTYDQTTDVEFLNRLNEISNQKFSNEEICADRQSCAIIIAEDKDETQFMEDYITTYNLRCQVFWLGNKFKETLRSLMTEATKEFFVLHWTPSDITHVVLSSNKTSLVNMPSCVNIWDESRPKTHFKCMFDPIPQIKFANAMLKKVSRLDLYLREQFTFTSQQYLDIIKEFESQNKTIEEFACDWLGNHPEFYRDKIDAYDLDDFVIRIGLITPDLKMSINPLVTAANRAINLIKELKWLKKHELKVVTDKDSFNQVTAMKVTDRISFATKVVIGPSRTSEIQIVAGKTYFIMDVL